MSVLIKGMEMPMVCRTCQFLLYINHYDELGVCGRTRKDVTQIKDKRDEDCPLIEIPTEHGRLIDADRMDLQSELFTFTRYTGIDEAPLEDATSILYQAPTVVPAEKGGAE